MVDKRIIQSAEKDMYFGVKNKPYDKGEWIYKQSENRQNRFLLGKRGSKTLICCGVNPSTASPEKLDPTMKTVETFARAKGYDSYIMINLYPQRATNPDDMHKDADIDIIKTNLECIEEVFSAGCCDIWAAWGNLITKRSYLKECLGEIVRIANKYNCKWYHFGAKTKDGHPHHPLYLSKECNVDEFDINTYLHQLK